MLQSEEKMKIEEIKSKLDALANSEQSVLDMINSENSISELLHQLVKKPKVCVVGLGYVGLPLAAVVAKKGYDVIGYDTDVEKLKLIENGVCPFKEEFLDKLLPEVKIQTTTSPSTFVECGIFIICVPTPIDKKYNPDLGPVISASKMIAQNMRRNSGSLVVLESTVNPGVSEGVIKPIFEEAGHVVGKDVFIAHCPERINPGDLKWNVSNLPRVVGSFDENGLAIASRFYESVIDAPIMKMKSIREAEAVKIMENSFRDVNIAFVNEMAKSFDLMNIDIVDVIKGASTKPFAFMPHWPSRGVGGHCIPVDPYYMIEKAKENDFDHKFLRNARIVNSSMPRYTIGVLRDSLNSIEKSVKGTKIGVLGVSYKANVGDLRESPVIKIIEILRSKEAILNVFDPYIESFSTVKSVEELLEKSEVILLATNHTEFIQIPVEKYKQHDIKVIIDGMNCLDKEAIKKAEIIYKGIGR